MINGKIIVTRFPGLITASWQARSTHMSPPACTHTWPPPGSVSGAGGAGDPWPCLRKTWDDNNGQGSRSPRSHITVHWPAAPGPRGGPGPGELLEVGDPPPELGAEAETEEADQPGGHHTEPGARQSDPWKHTAPMLNLYILGIWMSHTSFLSA